MSKNTSFPKPEFRVYSNINCGYFDLLDNKLEPAQTKGLGLVLSKHPDFLNDVLDLIQQRRRQPKLKIKSNDVIVIDCELTTSTNEGRADILIRIYDANYNPKIAFLIEAKSIVKESRVTSASVQLAKYALKLLELTAFRNSTVLVSLTRILDNTQGDNIVSITWEDIIKILWKYRKEDIISDYLHFLIYRNL